MNMRCLFAILLTIVGTHSGLVAQPVISTHPQSATTHAGATVAFRLSATAPAPIEYQWHLNGTDLPNATADTLQVTNVGFSHLGTYGVRLKSSGELVESNPAMLSLYVTLLPLFDPLFTVHPASNAVKLTWQGAASLEVANSPAGPWTNISGVRTSYTATASAEQREFYRLRNPHPRAVRVFVPSSYRREQPMPFIINFHGYLGTGQAVEDWLRVQPVAESHGFLYAYPDGVQNNGGYRFWNAANACCDFDDQNIDDSAFARSLILRARSEFNVDLKRVHVMGHSNGGFLAHRVAREHSDLIASIASISGVMDREDSFLPPKSPVHVLQVHGTADDIVPYDGGLLRSDIPRLSRRLPMTGAEETLSRWIAWNGCGSLQHDDSPTLDLVGALTGLDTIVSRAVSCSGAEAELWTIENASHGPDFTSALAAKVAEWLLAHPKP